jgi:hypothetical protein
VITLENKPLLSCARNRLHGQPAYVLFDAWYPPMALLKRFWDYGWYVVCRLKKNRRFIGQPCRSYRRHAYEPEPGWLSGDLTVLVVRYRAKRYATNRLTRPAAEVRRRYWEARGNRRGDPSRPGSPWVEWLSTRKTLDRNVSL